MGKGQGKGPWVLQQGSSLWRIARWECSRGHANWGQDLGQGGDACGAWKMQFSSR